MTRRALLTSLAAPALWPLGMGIVSRPQASSKLSPTCIKIEPCSGQWAGFLWDIKISGASPGQTIMIGELDDSDRLNWHSWRIIPEPEGSAYCFSAMSSYADQQPRIKLLS